MSNKFLYPCFNKWRGSIWFIADTHFDDVKIEKLRGISAETLVKNINKKATKNDTLVILGDVGNIEYVKQLKAGYKVLIIGNHDFGISKYKRIETKIADSYYLCNVCGHEVYPDFRDFYNCGDDAAYCRHCETTQQITYYDDKYEDNKLFDEVYEGQLTIRKNIVLSHELVNFPFALNIHGHVYPQSKEGFEVKTHLQYLKNIKDTNLKSLNCCAEYLNYEPINFNNIIKSGVLKEIEDIHRSTIDRAIERKIKNNNL